MTSQYRSNYIRFTNLALFNTLKMYSMNDNIPEKDFLILQFATKYVIQSSGNRLAVCGSVPELGEWNLQFAALADERPVHSGNWLASILIPPEIDIEWKWVEVKHEILDISAVCWEEGPNRRYNTGFERGRLETEWNKGCDFQHVQTKNEGVLCDVKDAKQLNKLLESLEEKAGEQSTNSNVQMIPPKRGVFQSMITWLFERYSWWCHLLKNSFRLYLDKFSGKNIHKETNEKLD